MKGRRFTIALGFDVDAAAGWRRANSHRITIGKPNRQVVRLAPEQARGPYAHLRSSARFVVEGIFRRDRQVGKGITGISR